MHISALGALEVRTDAGPIVIDSPKERAILEVLAAYAPDVVRTETLVKALWAEEPPPSAPKSLQSHVSRLRGLLPPEAIATENQGYLLRVDPDSIDVHRFECLVRAGRQALQGDEPQWAIELIDEALALWRGDPLPDLADSPLRTAERTRLEELRGAAVQNRIDAHLRLGAHEELLPELEALVAENPFNEGSWERLLVALYRSNRRADALAAHRRLRHLLREELGLDPSTRLVELETQILQDDPALLTPPPVPRRSLPMPITSFVGRVQQTRELLKLVQNNRLVTVLGPGGVGKSRLALEVGWLDAEHHPDGTWWVDLTNLPRAGDLWGKLAGVLRVVVPPAMAPAEAVSRFLSARRCLLLLDNAEGIAEELGPLLNELLESAIGTTAVVTSRAPLGVPGEHRYVLMPLQTQRRGDYDDTSEAVRLFLDRLEERSPAGSPRCDTAAAAAICELVDGLPLAIELAAASAASIGVEHTLAQLRAHRGLPESPGGDGATDRGASRHRGLLAVLSSTVELLDASQRRLLARLSVLRSTFEEPAAEQIATSGTFAADLGRLRDLSLVTSAHDPDGGRRLRLLDTTRAFAEGLGSGSELADAKARHAAYFLALAREAGPCMETADEGRWLERLQQDEADLDAAVEWYLEHDPACVPGFARALGRAWFVGGDLAAATQRLTQMLQAARSAGSTDPVEIGWLLIRLGWPQFLVGEFGRAMSTMEEAADLLAHTGEHVGMSVALAGRAHMVLLATADTDAAVELYRQGIEHARLSGVGPTTAWALAEAAQSLLLADRVDEDVEAMIAEAETLFTEAGDHFGLSHVCMDRMFLGYARDDLDGCLRACEEGIAHQQAAGNQMYEQILRLALGIRHVHLGELAEARRQIAAGIHLAQDAHNLAQLGIALQAAAVLAAADHDPERAARLWGAARSLGPVWPLFERRYGELLASARSALGPRWELEASAGEELSTEEAVQLALR